MAKQEERVYFIENKVVKKMSHSELAAANCPVASWPWYVVPFWAMRALTVHLMCQLFPFLNWKFLLIATHILLHLLGLLQGILSGADLEDYLEATAGLQCSGMSSYEPTFFACLCSTTTL